MLTESIKQVIKKHSLKESPKECCGLIIKNKDGFLAFPCRNRAKEKNRFRLDSLDYLKATCFGDVKAVYHSHFNSSDFSLFDQQQAKANKIKYVLYFVPKNEFRILDPSIKNNYIGRKYIKGINECPTLIKDYFWSELNIKINSYLWNPDWEEKAEILFDEIYLNEGFTKVENLKKNDIILFKFKKDFSEHGAIYLGDGLILHQPREKLSKIDSLDRYQKYINYIIRHKTYVDGRI